MHKLPYFVIAALMLLVGCAKDAPIDEEEPIVDERFVEGTVEMGMYSHGVDLGFFIENLDFSRDDVREQFAELAENNEEAQRFMELIESYSQRNPFLELAVMMNGVVCTYHIKGDAVLGKARGLGFIFDNYHNSSENRGQLYLQTLTQDESIPEADRAISVQYTPSENLAPGNNLELEMYLRQVATQRKGVAGYECQVTTYTLRPEHVVAPDPENPVPMSPRPYKVVAYTSAAFSPTINFTHPFYLEEEHGILQLEIYFENADEPTLVMTPDRITPRALANSEMEIDETQPLHDLDDLQVGWKMLAIMMSGWGALGDTE